MRRLKRRPVFNHQSLILNVRWSKKKQDIRQQRAPPHPPGSYPKSAQHERRGIKEHWLPLWIIFFIAGMRRSLWNAQWEKSPVRNALQTWIIPFKKPSHWSRTSPSFILAHNKPSVHKLQLQLDNWITCWKINCSSLLLHFMYYADWTKPILLNVHSISGHPGRMCKVASFCLCFSAKDLNV